MTDPFYIQTCALPDICSRCGNHRKVAEVRKLLGQKLITTLCLDCLEGSEYLT